MKSPSTHARNLAGGVSVALAAMLLQATSHAGDSPATSPATRPADQPMPQTQGPITYYIQHCARCHGDISAAYNGLKKPKRGKALRQVIDDMAAGPAQAPLDAAGLDEQVKLHEAMFDDKPYAWLDRTQNPPVAEKLDNTEAWFVYGDVVDTPRRTDGYRVEFHQEDGHLVIHKQAATPGK